MKLRARSFQCGEVTCHFQDKKAEEKNKFETTAYTRLTSFFALDSHFLQTVAPGAARIHGSHDFITDGLAGYFHHPAGLEPGVRRLQVCTCSHDRCGALNIRRIPRHSQAGRLGLRSMWAGEIGDITAPLGPSVIVSLIARLRTLRSPLSPSGAGPGEC